MKLDPAKTDYSRVIAQLEKLSALHPHRKGDDRDWAAETIKTLKAGRLESYDLEEFAAVAFQRELAGREDPRPVWEYSRALLGLIREMDARRIAGPRLEPIRIELERWAPPA